MKDLINYLKKISANITNLISLKFFRLLIAITFVLLLAIIILIKTHFFGIGDISLSELQYFLDENYLTLLVDGGSFILTLDIQKNKNLFIETIIEKLKERFEITQLTTTESIIKHLNTKYSDLSNETIQAIVKQYQLINKGEI